MDGNVIENLRQNERKAAGVYDAHQVNELGKTQDSRIGMEYAECYQVECSKYQKQVEQWKPLVHDF